MELLSQKLEGRVALVTGSGRGLGRAYALRLARLGADIVVNDVRLDAAKEFHEELTAETVMDECRAFGVRSIGVEADVTDRQQVGAMVERVVEELGSLDILINNAGGMLRPVENSFAASMPEEDLRAIVDLNLMSAIFCCQAAAEVMMRHRWGRIVNVSSQAGVRGGGGGFVNYGIAKAGIIHYTRCLAAELGPYGINVNCIAPALIRTSRATAQFPQREQVAEQIPLRRLGDPEDCAKVVEFFCTDLSDYVTGQCLAVCGGLVLSPT